MKYKNVIKDCHALNQIIEAPTSDHLEQYAIMLPELITYIADHEVYDDEFLDEVIAIELSTTSNSVVRIGKFITDFASFTKENAGDFAVAKSSLILDHIYVPSFNVAVASAIKCIDALSNQQSKTTEKQSHVIIQIAKLMGIFNVLEVYVGVLHYGYIHHLSKQKGGKNSGKSRGLPVKVEKLVINMAKTIWADKKYQYLPLHPLAIGIADTLKAIVDDFYEYGCPYFIDIGLCNTNSIPYDINGRIQPALQGVIQEKTLLTPHSLIENSAASIGKLIKPEKKQNGYYRSNAEMRDQLMADLYKFVTCDNVDCPEHNPTNN
jgi:hypothetical protein